jgi:hypothetical protein
MNYFLMLKIYQTNVNILRKNNCQKYSTVHLTQFHYLCSTSQYDLFAKKHCMPSVRKNEMKQKTDLVAPNHDTKK